MVKMSVPISLAHVFITGPFLIYVGLAKTKPVWVYYILLMLGLLLLLYFPYIIFTTKLSQYHVWLGIHLLLFIPLLIAIGVMQDKSPRILFSLVLAIGLASVGYHAIRLYQHYSSSS